MSSLAVDNTTTISESSKDLHYFIACIIPFLPLIDENDDDEIKTIITENKESIQLHPTYVTNKILFGTKLKDTPEYVINFDDIIMRMLYIYLKNQLLLPCVLCVVVYILLPYQNPIHRLIRQINHKQFLC